MNPFKLVNKTVFKELTLIFVLSIGIFLTLLLVGKMLRLKEILVTLDLSIFDILRLFFYLSPFFLLLLMPVAAMISIFLVFQRMSTDRELMALRAGGISLLQILPAPIIFLILCTGINMYISLFGISAGMNKFQNFLLDMAKTKTQVALQPGVFNQDFPGLTIYARSVNKGNGELRDVFIQDTSSADSPVCVIASRGKVMTDPGEGKILFSLSDGRIYHRKDKHSEILKFSSYQVSLDVGMLLGEVDIDKDEPKYISWNKLNARIQEGGAGEKEAENYISNLRVEKQKRLALPIACFVLGFFALPVGWVLEGMKRHYGALIILSMFFVYYALFTMGLSLGETGMLHPKIGVWVPNAIFFLFSLYIYRLAVKERGGWLVGWIKYIPGISKN